jgi:hypothetical protein
MLSAVPLGPPIYIHPTAADFYNTAHRADSSSKYVSHLVFYLLNFYCLLYFFFFPPRFCFSSLLLLRLLPNLLPKFSYIPQGEERKECLD